jgi:sigma-B regulation protein RsbU (phosphoserine phosphatase)
VGGAAISQLRSTGTVLGAVARPTFAEKIVHLGKRDVLFLYTDGLTEARSGLEQFGEERLFDTLVSVQSADPTTVVSRVTDRVDDFTGGDRRRDDIALLALRLARE